MVLWSLSSLPERPSDNHKEMPFSSDLCSFHLIYSSASKPTPPHPHLCTESHPVCRHTFGIMLHVQANCAAKGIISVHCRQPVNQSSFCFHHRALPFPPVHAVSSPAPTYSVPAGQGASQLVFSCLALLAPSGRPVAYTSQPGSQ